MDTVVRMTLKRPDPVRERWMRRLRIGLATATLAVPVGFSPFFFSSSNATTTLSASQKRQAQTNMDALLPLASIVEVAPKRVQFTGKDSDSKDFRSLNSYYVGKARLQIDWTDVDLTQNLRYMWARKMNQFTVTPATRKNVDGIIARFETTPHVTTTLSKFVDGADDLVDASNNSLDFGAFCARLNMSDRCGTVKSLADKINGRMLIAYGMTELFPSRDGDTNRRMLDMMLRRAGQDYINSIPALGDKYLSLGFYQFTSFAVRHDASGRQGASVVAEFSSKGLPGSVMLLNNDDQHRAAFFFATYNLALMVRSLNDHQYTELRRKGLSKEELTVFMATSHHLPGSAQRSMAAWLQDKRKHKLPDYLRGDLRVYGAKSIANYKAL